MNDPCPECLGPVPASKGGKPRRFCSARCSQKYHERSYFVRDYLRRREQGLPIEAFAI